jgi:uncharacterized protein (TIGR02145 family)
MRPLSIIGDPVLRVKVFIALAAALASQCPVPAATEQSTNQAVVSSVNRPNAGDCCTGRVGDANGSDDDEPTIGDVSVLIDAKFITGSCDGVLSCLTEADVNQSGGADPTCDDITIGDISILIDYLFISGSSIGLTECLTPPVLTTAAVSAITQTTAECGGAITSDGGAAVTDRGVCWSTHPTPMIADSKSSDGTGAGSFTSSLISLKEGTPYYVRAYATNSVGTGYGDEVSFSSDLLTVTDIDGNVYQAVTIGAQVWMKENLRVTHYRNGDVIPNVTDSATWSGLTTGAYSECNNDVDNAATYGRLYNWYAAADSRNMAPIGWHVASDAEYQTLVDYLGFGTIAGGKMKEAGTTHWTIPNTGATNESGFTALPSGYRGGNGIYFNMSENVIFWSSTDDYDNYALTRHLYYNFSNFNRSYYDKHYGYSVRCVRD